VIPGLLQSRLCTKEQLDAAWYRRWCEQLKEAPHLHRKLWEFCFIAQALHERGMLAPAKTGLGFGVGREPLAALFGSLGCTIVATDLDPLAARRAGWAESGQHAQNLEALNDRGICDSVEFRRLVSFRNVDMNRIPSDLTGFDFVWSSCSFEHVGSIELGQRFVVRAMDCLKPGGVAVHTTEFNVSSNSDTVTRGGTVIFRRRDIEAIAEQLRRAGHRIELDFDVGSDQADHYVDLPPYRNEPHLKLLLEGYVSTSIGLIIEKSLAPSHQRTILFKQLAQRVRARVHA